MQLRLFRHFIPISVVLLVSSDALLITAALYQMLSQAGDAGLLVFGLSSFPAQLSAGFALAAIAMMVSIGLYGEQTFVDVRLLISRISVAFVLVLLVVAVAVKYWRAGLRDLPDIGNLPLKATLVWLGCITLTRATFVVTSGPRAVEAADRRPRRRDPGGADCPLGRDRREPAFYAGLVFADAGGGPRRRA